MNSLSQSPLSFLLFMIAFASAAGHTATPLSLADAQRLAALDAPQLAAQVAALSAAEQSALGASQQADPKLLLGLDNLPVEGGDKFRLTRGSMTMRKIGFMQDFTRAEKLALRGERAAADVAKETVLLVAAKLGLRRDVALAWIERYFAERQLELVQTLARESELQIATTDATLAGGKGQATDAFTARLAVAQVADRITESERGVARARANLARWIGTAAASTPLDAAPAFDHLTHSVAALTQNLETHPQLAVYVPLQAMAGSETRLAEAARRPDWTLEVAFQQRGPDYSNMFSIGVRIDLPLFQSRRQNPAIISRAAQAEQVRAQALAATRAYAAEVGNWFADWNAARARLQRYTTQLLPLAHERTEVALAAYRSGRGELAAVLDARRAEIDVRLNHLQLQSELARTWAQLNFLLPDAKEPS